MASCQHVIRTLILTLAFPLTLSGCLSVGIGSGGASVPSGTFSYYSEVSFANENAFCLLSSDLSCIYALKNDFGSPMIKNGWQLHSGLTDGYINGQWTTPTTASQIISDSSNLVYLSSHGNTSNGQTTICLRYCNGNAYGNSIAINTVGIPGAWGGPNWLIVDACSAVQQNEGWEAKFGGQLHGILGFYVDGYGLQTSGRNTLASDIHNGVPAIKAWEDATAANDVTPQLSMLVPDRNASDVIEASGGPNFGYNGDTGPSYYQGQPDGSVVVTPPQGLTTTNVYDLVPESVNETQWYDKYGSPTGTWVTPSSNEHKFVSSGSIVTHYLASGGIIAEQNASGTAGAIGESAAQTYALNWLSKNGGLPTDAVLSYVGKMTNPYPNAINYQCSYCAIPTTSLPAHNNVRQ